jgi:hypothetical protein
VANWNYTISTSTPTESSSFEVLNTATGASETPEFHTLMIQGSSSSGGETYIRELLLVEGYYYEDVASQYPCQEGSTNGELTWKIDLFSDTARLVPAGCVVLGHDPSYFSGSGCSTWTP